MAKLETEAARFAEEAGLELEVPKPAHVKPARPSTAADLAERVAVLLLRGVTSFPWLKRSFHLPGSSETAEESVGLKC